jgi:hypothetical protein
MGLNDDVASVDAHAERNAAVPDLIDCNFLDAGLELHRGPNRFDSTRKLRQEPVSGVLDYAAAVFGNCRMDGLRQEHCQFGVRTLFVIVHEPRVASHVGCQYRRQPALDPAWRLLRHGTQIPPIEYSTMDQPTVPNALLRVTVKLRRMLPRR